jgi:hypothetical protein
MTWWPSTWLVAPHRSTSASATAWGVVEAAVELVWVWEDPIENVPSWSGLRQLSQAPFSQLRGPFS